MPVVEYKLHLVGRNAKRAPEWVDDGGYWQNPADSTMVGWVLPESDREFYVPDTVTELSRAEFIARSQAIHAATPMTKMNEADPMADPIVMTDAEVVTEAGTWYDSFHAS